MTEARLMEIENYSEVFAGQDLEIVEELIAAVRAYQKLLSEGVRVYGDVDDCGQLFWGYTKRKFDTHTGLLVRVKKIEG